MDRRVGTLVCVVAGHRWVPTGGAHADQVVLRCRRCEAESVLSAEMIEAESYAEKYVRAEVADNPFLNPRDFDSRLPKRR